MMFTLVLVYNYAMYLHCVKLSFIAKFLLCVSPLAEVLPETDHLLHMPFGHWGGGCHYHCVGPLESIQSYIMTLI